MTLINIIKSTFLQIYTRKASFIATTIVLIISFLVVEYALYIVVPICASRQIVEHVFVRPCEQIHYMFMMPYFYLDEEQSRQMYEWLGDIHDIPEVEGAGAIYLDHTNGSEENDLLMVPDSLLFLADWKDVDGKKVSFEQEGEYRSVIVGYDLGEKYPVGTILKGIYGDNQLFKVTHVLQKKSLWMSEEAAAGAYINMDQRFLVNADTYFEENPQWLTSAYNGFCYVVREGADAAQVEARVCEMAEARGVEVYSQKSIAEKIEYDLKDVVKNRYIFLMPVILLLMAMLVMIISSMAAVHLRRQGIGVLYAIGYSRSNIYLMYILENVLKVWIAFTISDVYWFFAERDMLALEEAVSLLWLIRPVMLFISIVFVGIGSALPLVRLNRFEISRLIGGEVA